MDLKLTGKRALVTGSSSGIGAEIARMLAREGATVLVHGRNQERVDAVVAHIRAAGGHAEAILGDLNSSEEIATVIQNRRWLHSNGLTHHLSHSISERVHYEPSLAMLCSMPALPRKSGNLTPRHGTA